VYGEFDAGGTSVLYLSDIPLDFLSWGGALDQRPLPELTWAALKNVPPIVLLVGGVMTGVHWVIGRRMKLARDGAVPEYGEGPRPSARPAQEAPGDAAGDGRGEATRHE
jgi:formate dehydrogenase iron-sulfur subunit